MLVYSVGNFLFLGKMWFYSETAFLTNLRELFIVLNCSQSCLWKNVQWLSLNLIYLVDTICVRGTRTARKAVVETSGNCL